jgi:hypothetical protein
VHQKLSDSTFDLIPKGIEMYIDGDWVKLEDIGADNGWFCRNYGSFNFEET